MRKLLVVCGLLALGVFMVFSMVAAQSNTPPGFTADQTADGPVSPDAIAPRTSHTLVQNMENMTASLHIQYYRENGQVAHEFDDVLPPNGSKSYHANDASYGLGASFLGSMVVSSDRQIVAVVLNAGATSHDLYEGTSAGATEGFLPSVHWRALQYTLVGIQNTDPSVTATVAYTYYLQDGTALRSFTKTVPPNTAIHPNALNEQGENLAGVGSLKATSLNGQNIVLAAIETLYDETNSYRGYTPSQGAAKVYLPSVHRNMGGQFTHTLVQNMTNQSNRVRITYYKQDGTEAGVFEQNLGANGSWTFHTGPLPSGNPQDPTALGNVGSAVIESLDGRNFLAVCLEAIGGITVYTYDGQTANDAASKLLFPSVHRNVGGQFSHTLIQNLSTSAAANLTVTYYQQNGSIAKQFNKTLPANGSYTFHTGAAAPPAEDPTALANVGSLVVECTNCSGGGPQIVGVCIETLTTANIPAAYAGFKQQ
jgi:hypothetical protein